MLIKVGFTTNIINIWKNGVQEDVTSINPILPEGIKNFSIISEDIPGGTVTIIDLDVKAQNDNAAFIAESKKTDTIPDAAVIE